MLHHTAEIVAVGTELLLGSIANTNAQYLSQELNALGIGVCYHTVVGDNPERLRKVLAIARERADIVITTGGLGPTYDDLTKTVVAESFGRKLVYHPEIEAVIRRFFETSMHVPMTENNLQQAWLPENCTVLPNAAGTAPGCAFEEGGVHVLMLPGPPHELECVFEREAKKYLQALSQEVIRFHDIRSFGLGESAVEDLLRAQMERMVNPSLATYAKPSEVRLRATARAATEAEAEEMLAPVVAEVRAVLGDYVYGVDVESLPAACLSLLKERGQTFATAESCTGGLLSQEITALPGSSAVYRGGVVSYWTAVKAGVLGCPRTSWMPTAPCLSPPPGPWRRARAASPGRTSPSASPAWRGRTPTSGITPWAGSSWASRPPPAPTAAIWSWAAASAPGSGISPPTTPLIF